MNTHIAKMPVDYQFYTIALVPPSFPLLFAFVVGGLGFEFCVFVAGWRHALRSEWPFYFILFIYSLLIAVLELTMNE